MTEKTAEMQVPQSVSILAHHKKEWLGGSGVSQKIVDLNVRSLEDNNEIDKALDRNTDSRQKHSDLAPGWLVSGVDPRTGEPWGMGQQFKPDNPPVWNDKEQKYLCASGSPTHPLFLDTGDPDYWPEVIKNHDQDIYVTEGPKKQGCLMSIGLATISLPGVWNFRQGQESETVPGLVKKKLHPLLELFCQKGRKVYLAFDSDLTEKDGVRKALIALGKKFKDAGCEVFIVQWNQGYKGIDDLKVKAGEQAVRDVIAQALTYEEWSKSVPGKTTKDADNDGETNLQRDYRVLCNCIGDRFSYNTLTASVELDKKPFPLGSAKLNLEIDHRIKLRSSDQNVAGIVDKIARKQTYNPVEEYLNECFENHSKSPILDGLAKKLFRTEEPIHQTYLVRWLIAACARACQPGCAVHSVLVLQGGQGIGKSSFFRALAGDGWFNDNHPPMQDKDFKLNFYGKWIHEWGEMEAVFGQGNTSKLKSFITSSTDRLRRPYGRDQEDLLRSWVICASTNQTEFLRDPTGNRRFWVLPVNQAIDFQWVKDHRDEIWGAVMAQYREGQQWHLTSLETRQQEEDVKRWQETDVYESIFIKELEGQEMCTALEVCIGVLKIEKPDQRDKNRAANMLKRNGWTSLPNPISYKDQRKCRVWVNPNARQQIEEMETEQIKENIFYP
jgi:predicted P-loop ATPase